MPKVSLSAIAVPLCAALLLCACSPKLDWREVRGTNVPYTVLLPAKPTSASRPVELDGLHMTLTMTAAEAEDVTYAVGSTELPDAAAAQRALAAMKSALVKNVGGAVRNESTTAVPGLITTDMEAVGRPGSAPESETRLMFARLVAKDRRVYQLVAVGKEKAVSREAVDTFLSSFKPG
ncbi:hypothetical protein [Noviherbaspirillum massiliense]|uniref:hypothetical protein n=1 Tax=Noviherbaspirillum massiliense TaxID=1465823 RepID=UPI0005519111|nr:hypothetical protein [Noviherbaspirillum massiliense]